MIDKEKVIKELTCCIYSEEECECPKDCPYNDGDMGECQAQVMRDALAMLKEQDSGFGHWIVLENCSNSGVYCSECNTKIFDSYPMKKKLSYFCPHCGTRMEGQVAKSE